jgi:type IV secretory pathway VirJ component
MKRVLLLIIILMAVFTPEARPLSSYDSLNIGPFGKVYIYLPKGTPKNVIIMISGDAGWKYGVVSFAEEFSRMNNIVIGVDILRYFSELRLRTEECYRVATDFVDLATRVEEKYNLPEYEPAVVMGYSSGATLVYGILAQSRPGTFLGGISLGFCADVELPKMLCETNGLFEKPGIPGKSYYLQPDAKLGNHWIVLQGKIDKICNYEEVSEFVSKTTDAELITLPDSGHGFSEWSNFMPQWKSAFRRLISQNEKAPDMDAISNNIKELPLTITKPKSDVINTPAAFLISGDGGWYSFEQSIADKLAEKGIPTIGLDSKKYFWQRKTPEKTAEDVANSLLWYGKEWNKDRFMIIGYSLGAEIVPFVVNRLPSGIRDEVMSSVLLSPESSTDFEIHFTNMLGIGNRKNVFNVAEEIKKMHPVRTLVIYGDGEKTEMPGMLSGSGAIIKKIPGDHHYKYNVPLIVNTMKENETF